MSSLGQMYYSNDVFPHDVSPVVHAQISACIPGWHGLAVYCFFSPIRGCRTAGIAISRWTAFTLPTVGWGLLILVIATAAATWWWNERRSEG